MIRTCFSFLRPGGALLRKTVFLLGLALPHSTLHAAPQVWVASSMENIFKDTGVPANPVATISLIAARNEYESVQICLRDSATFTVNSVACSNLVKGTSQISSSAIQYKFVEYLQYNSNSLGLTHKVRTAPAEFPDALSNDTARTVAANTTQPVWLTVKVPKAQTAGIYLGTVTLNTTAGAINLPISVEVVAAEIPDASAGFLNAPMFQLTYENGDVIESQYGYPRYSSGWWNVLDKMCINAVSNRTNVVYIVPIQLLLDGGSTKSGSTWSFNWSKFDQYVEFFLSRGFRYIWAEGLCYVDDPDVWVSTIGGDSAGGYYWDGGLVGSTKATTYLNQFLPALKTHLQAKGWENIFVMQILDEPRDDQHDGWNAVAALVPPEIKLADTFFLPTGVETHQDLIDAWIPSIALYEQKKSYFEGRKSMGDKKWFYTYGENAGNWLNRVIDTPVYKNRLLFWYASAFNMDGYLQWGYNWWGDPAQDQVAHGDPWIIYPDLARGTVRSSIRESNQRDGVEELELFSYLKTFNPTRAQQILNDVVISGTGYTNFISQITASRTELLRAAGPASIAASGTVSACSSAASGYGPAKAIDGIDSDEANWWRGSTASYPQWIEVDLGSNKQIAGTQLVGYAGRAYRFRVEAKVSGGTYQTIIDRTASTQPGIINDSVAATTARYVKLTVTGAYNYTGGWTTIQEFKVFEVPNLPPLSLAKGGTISGYSSQDSANPAGRTIDGVNSISTNFWRSSSAVYPQWIEINLGADKQISGTELIGYDGRAYRFRVEAKLSGGTYQTVVDRTASSQNTPAADSFTPVTARYVKLTITGAYNYTGNWTSIHEFKVFGN